MKSSNTPIEGVNLADMTQYLISFFLCVLLRVRASTAIELELETDTGEHNLFISPMFFYCGLLLDSDERVLADFDCLIFG